MRWTLLVLLIVAGCARKVDVVTQPVPAAKPETANAATVSMWRSQFDSQREQWRATFQGAESPLAEAQRAGAEGPEFFPFAPEWRLIGDFQRLGPASHLVELPATRSKTQGYFEYGRFPVASGADTVQLVVYRPVDHPDQYFIPFADGTSGADTYGGGRYVHLDSLDVHRWILDFNKAYNPYCAYDTSWICPLPPPANHLPFPVRAGMMAPKEHP
jgi:uncharacterized protein (DUF1684 family)